MDYPKSTPSVGLVGGKFVDENTGTGQPGSLIPAAWGNAVTDELLAVIAAAGFTPSESDLGQLLKAIQTIAASDIKRSVRVATTGAIALSGLQTIDGYMLVAGDRVLVKDQANAAQNWIYTAAAGTWSRALDANESAECTPGHLVIVEAGTAHAGSIWQLSNTTPPTVGTTALNFSRLFGKTGVAAGSYQLVTVDAQGRVVAGSNPSTLEGNGITDGATKAYVQAAIAALVDSSPAALDTLKELAAALGNDPNFATTMTNSLAGKMPIAGGAYTPVFSSLGANTPVGAIAAVQGGYMGWNGAEGGLSGEMHFICNSGLGAGGFSWRSINRDNTATGPTMTYSFDGTLGVPKALSVPAITSNTTVPTQAATDNSQRIASTAYVKAAIAALVAGSPGTLDTLKELADALGNDPNFATSVMNQVNSKAARDSITTLGFAGNDVTLPYMRRESDGQVYYLQPRLGYTPLQQGGGAGMSTNKLYIGWSAEDYGLRLQVDNTLIGAIWSQQNFCRPDANNFLPVMVTGQSLTLPAGGTWCYSLMHYASGGAGIIGKGGIAAGGTVISFSGGTTIYGFAWRYTN